MLGTDGPLDIPASMEDWWIYLIPGGFLVVGVFFLLDALTHLVRTSYGTFQVGSLVPYVQSYYVAVLLALAVASLILGSLLEGLSASFFERVQDETKVQISALERVRKTKLFAKAMKDLNFLPAEIRPANSENVTADEWKEILDYLTYLIYSICNEREVGPAEETNTARTFTQCFFLSFLISPAFGLWFLGRGNVFLALLTFLAIFGMGFYLWRDSRTLGSLYYVKIFTITYTHISSGTKEASKAVNVTFSKSM
jgi:small-conductance mechanosensitive channel